MSTIINGTSNAITFPDSSVQNTSAIVSGYVPYANLPSGSVLQVVQTTTTTNTSTTSSSFVNFSALNTSITPKFATSKILIIAQVNTFNGTIAVNNCTLYRNGATNLAGSGYFNYTYGWNTVNVAVPTTMTYLDSPATTSSTTYGVYGKTGGGSMDFNNGLSLLTMTLMEIAG
jgi:hypothetical protein